MENFEEITREEDPTTTDNKEEIQLTNEPTSARKKIQKGPVKWNDNATDCLNFLVHLYFVKQDYVECLETLLKYSKSKSGYESIYSSIIKGLIKRAGGNINESNALFKLANNKINYPNSGYLLKEIGKNFLLLGKFKMAIEIYDNVLKTNEEEWDCLYHKGICYMNMKDYNQAKIFFDKANDLYISDDLLKTYGKFYLLNNDINKAIEKYEEALELCPNDSDLMTAIGSLYLKQNDNDKALEYFNDAMKIDPKYSNSLLGIASIYQYQGDFKNALLQYKISTLSNPNSAQVWNNIGLIFFVNNKLIAAQTCLKKALYLNPFEWIISFNLGLIYLSTQQYSSAFIYMNTAANLNEKYYLIFMYLGVILSELDDIDNAISYYEKALHMQEDYIIYFNYIISLIKNEMFANAKEKYGTFIKLYNSKKGNSSDDQFIEEELTKIKKILS